MMGSMLIFFLWMCYFCRCKDPKPEDDSSTVSSANQPYPYWIDIPDDNDTEERITICDDNEVGFIEIFLNSDRALHKILLNQSSNVRAAPESCSCNSGALNLRSRDFK